MNIYRKLYAGMLVLAFGAGFLGVFPAGKGHARAPALQATTPPGWFLTPTTAASPTPEKVDFTLASMNAIAPGDVMSEMYMFGGGGRGAEPCDPAPLRAQGERLLMEPFVLVVCWSEIDTRITFKAFRPDGQIESIFLYPYNGQVLMGYRALHDYPVGKYILRLEGTKARIEVEVIFSQAKTARLLEVPVTSFWPSAGERGSYRKLILEHFLPGEKVRLFVYKSLAQPLKINASKMKLVGWQDLVMRGDGSMPVAVNLPDIKNSDELFFAALGEYTGEVHLTEIWIAYSLVDRLWNIDLFCPGAKPTRLETDSTAIVIYAYYLGLPIRPYLGTYTQTTALIPKGAKVDVLNSTRCFNNTRYWWVRSEKDTGWAAEADLYGYLLEPVD